jgi:hypothetical protein
MKSQLALRLSIISSAILVVAIYFIYPAFSWPLGLEAYECLIALLILAASAIIHWLFRNKSIIILQTKNVTVGLWIGLLWTIEIGINNIIHPGLPLRDIVDNIFWAVIAILILIFTTFEAFHTKKIFAGIISGFWIGLASGTIACLTALILIVFGMSYILNDPLNLKEWSDVAKSAHFPNMVVYFAYQTLTGAIMHFVILGAIMGLILGAFGGIIGKNADSFKK